MSTVYSISFPITQPAGLTHPIFGFRFRENPIKGVNGPAQVHALLKGKDDPCMVGIAFSQDDEITYVVGKNGAALSGRAKQLLLITCIERHPIRGSTRHIMTSFQQGFVKGLTGSICIEM